MPSEINVQVETHEVEVKTFMPKMPDEKRPTPVALEPRFQLVLECVNEESKQAQENQVETTEARPSSVVKTNTPTEPIVSITEVGDNVSGVTETPCVPQVQPLENSQKSIGLKNRLYELSEKGRLARMFDAVKGLFSKHHKNQR